MSHWEIKLIIKSVATGKVIEELDIQTFDSRLEAERFMKNHPTWSDHFTFPIAELYHPLNGRIILDPTNWNAIHAKRNHEEN